MLCRPTRKWPWGRVSQLGPSTSRFGHEVLDDTLQFRHVVLDGTLLRDTRSHSHVAFRLIHFSESHGLSHIALNDTLLTLIEKTWLANFLNLNCKYVKGQLRMRRVAVFAWEFWLACSKESQPRALWMRGGARLDVRCRVNLSFDKTGRANTTVNNKYHDSICGRWPSRVCFLKPRDSRRKVRSWLAAVKLWSCSNLKTSGF